MCTAISFFSKDFYFGRNLDLAYHYEEHITVTPRKFPLNFKFFPKNSSHFAMIGTATKEESFPLYYEAANEKGLCMAGLNFPKNAEYSDNGNVAAFELIPYVLSTCETVEDARTLLKDALISSVPFSEKFPSSTLHFIVSDKDKSIVLEQTKRGFDIFDDPVNVLTNDPPFEMQIENLTRYMHLSASVPENTFDKKIPYNPASAGFAGIGIPGDWSSSSRFVRAAFALSNSEKFEKDIENVSQFFHILGAVAFPKGVVRLEDGRTVGTVYSCCINASKGDYYYTTYDNINLNKISLKDFDLESDSLVFHPMF